MEDNPSLGDYIKQMRTNLLLTLENNKETSLKVFDDISHQLVKAYAEIDRMRQEEKQPQEKPKKKKKQ